MDRKPDLAEALRRVGIHAGFPHAREKLAELLTQQSPAPTPTVIDALGQRYHHAGLRNPPAFLVHVLRTGTWREIVEDLHHSAHFMREPSPNSDPAPRWTRDGEVPSFLDSSHMPCGCLWGKHPLGPRACTKAGFRVEC